MTSSDAQPRKKRWRTSNKVNSGRSNVATMHDASNMDVVEVNEGVGKRHDTHEDVGNDPVQETTTLQPQKRPWITSGPNLHDNSKDGLTTVNVKKDDAPEDGNTHCNSAAAHNTDDNSQTHPPLNKPKSFLDLSGELRNKIYILALRPAQTTNLEARRYRHHPDLIFQRTVSIEDKCSEACHGQHALMDAESCGYCLELLAPRLLATCRQINSEASAVLYDTHFHFGNTNELNLFVEQRANDTIRYLRNISVEYCLRKHSDGGASNDADGSLCVATRLSSLVAKAQDLEKISVRIANGPISRIASVGWWARNWLLVLLRNDRSDACSLMRATVVYRGPLGLEHHSLESQGRFYLEQTKEQLVAAGERPIYNRERSFTLEKGVFNSSREKPGRRSQLGSGLRIK